MDLSPAQMSFIKTMNSLDNKSDITVEVAYAMPNEQLIVPVKVHAGITAVEAIKASGIMDKYPEINLVHHKVGIFGKLVNLDAPLRHLDRVEIYRPLLADPKVARRQRVIRDSRRRR